MASTANVKPQLIELGEGNLTLKAPGDAAAVDVGGAEGAELSYVPEYLDLEVGQALSAIKTVMIGEKGTFKITLAESSMRNLAIAAGLDPVNNISSSVSDEAIVFGGFKSETLFLGEYKVPQIDTPTKNYIVTMFKMRPTSGLVLPFKKKEARKFEVTFQLIADTTQNAALGKIVREK